MSEREHTDEEMDELAGWYPYATTLEDLEKRIDDLELELWNQNEALSQLKIGVGATFLAVVAVFGKLSGWF